MWRRKWQVSGWKPRKEKEKCRRGTEPRRKTETETVAISRAIVESSLHHRTDIRQAGFLEHSAAGSVVTLPHAGLMRMRTHLSADA